MATGTDVTIIGTVASKPEYSHGEKYKYYKFMVAVKRKSGVVDRVPVVASEEFDIEDIVEGKPIGIRGEFRSFDKWEGEKRRLILYVHAVGINFIPFGADTNKIEISGIVCKMDEIRETPMGRRLMDFMVAVNRQNNKSDYIPCITWEACTKIMENARVGDIFKADGRIQSRTYVKEGQEHEVYEVSIGWIRYVGEKINGDEHD